MHEVLFENVQGLVGLIPVRGVECMLRMRSMMPSSIGLIPVRGVECMLQGKGMGQQSTVGLIPVRGVECMGK